MAIFVTCTVHLNRNQYHKVFRIGNGHAEKWRLQFHRIRLGFCEKKINSLRFSLFRETETKKLNNFEKLKSLNVEIYIYTKIGHSALGNFIIQELKFFVSVAFMRENLRELREFFSQKPIQSDVWPITRSICRLLDDKISQVINSFLDGHALY